MDFTYIVIVIVFFLLDKGHEAENLQKECLFLLYYIMYFKTIMHIYLSHFKENKANKIAKSKL